ncbi:MAG: hypothetical protein M1822_009123 [Bathelium mastoideum]|nr:MAG: hypothetical protein M1822_009123 [Bathelium mastoideum]
MATGRSVLEYTFYLLVAVSIYIAIGAPGLPEGLLQLHSSNPETSTPLSQTLLDSLVHPNSSLHCPPHPYTIHLFSPSSPLIIYIENFLSASERAHLLALSAAHWQPATIVSPHDGSTEIHDPAVRNSSKALLTRDPTVQCIERRALALQGWPCHTFLERLWAQRYGPGGHYSHHFDWGAASKSARRVSSFMVYVDANCTGGGTNFPRLEQPRGGKWERFLEGEEEGVEGTTFRAVAGNAVFWMNFDAEGRGYRETIHAGMPVRSGTKVGLNVWSWYQAGYEPEVQGEREL